MGRYTGPKWKLCRREGLDLFSRGPIVTRETPLQRRDYPPGMHSQRRSKISEYGLRIREKQKLKRIYGVRERQCVRYYHEAVRMKGDTGDNLLNLMERRLDAVITTAGFAKTIAQARQLVVHGHFRVNDRRVDVPSFRVRPGDVIQTVEKDGTRRLVDENLELNARTPIPTWVQVERDARKATVMRYPTRDEFPYPIVESLIVEFYAR